MFMMLLFIIRLCVQEVLANEKAQSSNPVNEEVDLDELMDVSAIVSYFEWISRGGSAGAVRR